MAKINISKLNLSKDIPVLTVSFNNIHDIAVKQYLPAQEKLDMITFVLGVAVDPNRPYFYDIGRFNIMLVLEIIKHYTNISFTEKQLEEPQKLYDLIVSNGLWTLIEKTIPEQELQYIHTWSENTMNAIITHSQSMLGILESVANDYKNLQLDAESLKEKITDPSNMEFLKQILPLMNLT